MEKRIDINIFGRQFPAKVDSEEAAVILEAARRINEKIKALKAQYKDQDDLSIALMCCLAITTEHLKKENRSKHEAEEVLEAFSLLEQKLDASLQTDK